MILAFNYFNKIQGRKLCQKIAVVLAGCGHLDGAEIHESTLTLLYLSQAGVNYECLAPNRDQHHVLNHLNQKEITEKRNILIEAARIARGNIKAIDTANINDYDAVIFPGGFGAAKNLCDFALKGQNFNVQADVLSFAKQAYQASLPLGFICIAPIMISTICGPNIEHTLGDDQEMISIVNNLGGKHVNCKVDEIAVDEKHKIVSTPAYMLANNIAEAATGIEKLVNKVISLI
ncbi:isoprenoid biosynthesis glyoxalase ElbB [Piscirickettsia litoralis]|uniref:Glyoxalase n=1 Tax=Piscirickettsia litoralis TaxID=1891921 RepID=A0ABX3A3F7_9GAMM|nr:isoprenoid biosynthesis glyoxalase ElbB [Piscirickettsia litoralis]ODN43378.1 isoprenoid biosynthesis protein ElbB [Piscirickettsia litoralis]